MAIRRGDEGLEGGSTWAEIVERKIQEAIERGLFDNLQGMGKPLQIEENPYEGEWRLAFKILKNAGAAPAWIELSREIEADLTALDRLAEAARSAQGRNRQALVAECLRRLEEINSKIDNFNLAVPMLWLQKPRINPKALSL